MSYFPPYGHSNSKINIESPQIISQSLAYKGQQLLIHHKLLKTMN